MNLSISEIVKVSRGKLFPAAQDSRTADGQADSDTYKVTGVEIDSRKVAVGAVFLATVGQRVDGHRFIAEVFAKGAALVIGTKQPEEICREHQLQMQDLGNYLLVADCFQTLRDIAEYYRSKLTIPVVGITGSVGKTSTKEFIAGVLGEAFQVLKTEGNYNNEVGVPLTLLRIREEHEAAVVEMGISDFGEMRRLSKMVRPNLCVMTNIGQCHLENLKTRDGILKAKSEIFDYMAEDGEVFLNGEDDKLSTLLTVRGKQTHFFGLGGNVAEEIYATEIKSKGLFGSEATLHIQQEVFPIQVSLPGAHMVINACAAAGVAHTLGLSKEQIVEGIKKVSALSGRNHLIQMTHFTVIDDCYNANPVSMKAALDLLQRADTYKVAILGDMFELGTNSDMLHAEVGSYAVASGVDDLICVGENSKHMFEAATKTKNVGQKVAYYATRQELQEALSRDAMTILQPGATVLVKASHGMQFTAIVQQLRELS